MLESLFTRDARVKDSASIIPAFGGVLDVVDSLLPTAPLACWILLKS
ncbi:MAG: phosphatidate cytidylyltransferase [Planctomycetota bacterium]